jgi:hypothetical protein
MTTTFEHLQPDNMRARAKMFDGLPIAPSMQTIIVDGVPIVDPQFASVI